MTGKGEPEAFETATRSGESDDIAAALVSEPGEDGDEGFASGAVAGEFLASATSIDSSTLRLMGEAFATLTAAGEAEAFFETAMRSGASDDIAAASATPGENGDEGFASGAMAGEFFSTGTSIDSLTLRFLVDFRILHVLHAAH